MTNVLFLILRSLLFYVLYRVGNSAANDKVSWGPKHYEFGDKVCNDYDDNVTIRLL